jgi:alpha-D-ribose 1-methylphosphonate 5-triphosphate diphosphatase
MEVVLMSNVLGLYGGPIFDGERWMEKGWMTLKRGLVCELGEGNRPPFRIRWKNARGKLICPGLVDLHSDALEKWIEMRPGVRFDHNFSLINLDIRLASCGITTFCHGVSFADSEFGLRSCESAKKLVKLINSFDRHNKGKIRHKIHLRYEITNVEGLSIVTDLISKEIVDVVSIMDHTPGQGQFRDLESYLRYATGTFKVTREEVLKVTERKNLKREEGLRRLETLFEAAKQVHVPVLSHDDDTSEKVKFVKSLGVTASEFPVTLEAALEARFQGMMIFMGAPNMVRDRSSNGHLRASEALRAGVCDGLMSDYYPECLIQGALLAHRRDKLCMQKAMKLVTSGPAKLLKNSHGTGRLIEGGPADFLVVDLDQDWAHVLETWVSGRRVYVSQPMTKEGGLTCKMGATSRASNRHYRCGA